MGRWSVGSQQSRFQLASWPMMSRRGGDNNVSAAGSQSTRAPSPDVKASR